MFISLPRQPNGFARGFAFIEFNSYTLAENTAKDFNSRKGIKISDLKIKIVEQISRFFSNFQLWTIFIEEKFLGQLV